MCEFCKLAHYFEAKVGRGYLLRPLAALLNMYYGKSAVPVLILSQQASKQLALSVVTRDEPT